MRGFYLFSFKGIPVFASGWYLILMAYLFMTAGVMAHGLIFVGIATFGILVHEFGHGLMARRLDLQPSIVLHGWGGLCAHRPAKRDAHEAAITAAGPGAGLILGLASLALQFYMGRYHAAWLTERPLAEVFLQYMVWVNVGWSILNLIPLWPLDGGQLLAVALRQKIARPRAFQITHVIGIGVGVALVGLGIWTRSFFIILIAGMLTYANIARLRAGHGQSQTLTPSKSAEDIYQRAVNAAEDHHWEEVARLGHQMRAEGRTPDQIARAWELLAVSTTNLGHYEEAYRYVLRAPQTEAVKLAKKRCEEELQLPSEPAT